MKEDVVDCIGYYCIIGSGAAGIATAIELNKKNIKYKIFEKNDCVGGVWSNNENYSRCYEKLTTNTSKYSLYLEDYPHDNNVDYYMGYNYLGKYLNNVFDQECSSDDLVSGVEVTKVISTADDNWIVVDQNSKSYIFSGVIVCSGNAHKPNLPDTLNSESKIKQIHSSHYKNADILVNKNVVVVGSGQSAIDILQHSIENAKSIVHSIRHLPGWMITPEKGLECVKGEFMIYDHVNTPPEISRNIGIIFGKKLLRLCRSLFPDVFLKYLFKKNILRTSSILGLRKKFDKNISLKFFPVTKSFINNYANCEYLHTKGEIVKISEESVEFDDGYILRDVDLVVFATGYKQNFSFLDDYDGSFVKSEIDDKGLYFGFMSKKTGLYFVGDLYPLGAHWKVFEAQARLIAELISKNIAHSKMKEIFKNEPSKLKYSACSNGENYSGYIDMNRYIEKSRYYINLINNADSNLINN